MQGEAMAKMGEGLLLYANRDFCAGLQPRHSGRKARA